MRWKAGGQNYVRPAEMPAVVEELGRSAAALSRKLAEPPKSWDDEPLALPSM